MANYSFDFFYFIVELKRVLSFSKSHNKMFNGPTNESSKFGRSVTPSLGWKENFMVESLFKLR